VRLLFANERVVYAGTSTYSLDLAVALKKTGHEVQVCTTGGDLRQVFADCEIETYLARPNLLSYWKLLEFLRDYDPDLIHIQNRQSALFGQKLSRRLRVPHVITVHRLPAAPKPRLSHPRLAGIIAANEVIREYLVNDQGLPKSLIRVIPRGVDTEALVPDPDMPTVGPSEDLIPVLGSVGSLTTVKGHHVFIKAARRVLDRGIECMFAIVGEGEEEQPLRRLVKELRLESRVTFSPHMPNRRELYRTFDIVVVPTLRGGVGSTVLEAMAMGKPIIASAVGEILHILQEGKTGLLVPEGNAEALATRIVELLEKPDLARSLGKEARASAVEHFALSAMVEATRQFYEEVLTRVGRRGLASVT